MIGQPTRSSPDTVITTHLNADFDAVASALAASLLYDGSRILLPGSQEKAVRDLFEGKFSGPLPDLPLIRMKRLDASVIRRLIIVDTNQRNRLGPLAFLLDLPGVEIILYDHHTASAGDIPSKTVFSRPVGANTTMMVELLQEKGISVTPAEATLLALGIYEDTGSFTFPSTTPEDLQAVAWLLEHGADLKSVHDYLFRQLTPEHVEILDDLLHAARVHHFGGVPIVIAKTSRPDYVEDFALLAHEIMDIRGLDSVFVIALMADQVVIVGRSRVPSVDAGRILQGLGGGGHASAASATIKGITLLEAEERLIAELSRQLGHEPRVRDIMSSPVHSIKPETTISEAHDHLTRLGITVLPIVEDGKVLGMISRRTIEKALYHGLDSSPVRDYMSTEFLTVQPEDTLRSVQDIIVGHRQRFLPVIQDGRITGVVTRTDLLQILTGDPGRQPEPLLDESNQGRNLARFLRERLDKRISNLLVTAGETAEEKGVMVYVVGGFVRDLLLRVPNLDLDLVVEGNGIDFACSYAKRLGGRIKAHKEFGTAVVILPDGFKIDVATARWEYYEYPAAMPTVALSSIKLDLYRRDFTINTMAIKLNPPEFGRLIDFFGGQRDLKDKMIRVLHSLSFVEDPTRIFRAIRFEQRYGFTIGKHTLRLIKNALALDIFSRLSGKRLFAELKLILDEPDPRPAIIRCAELDLLPIIHPNLSLTPTVSQILSRTYDVLAWHDLLFTESRPRRWLVYLMALLSGLRHGDLAATIERLGLEGETKRLLTHGLFLAGKAEEYLSDRENPRASEIHKVLTPLKIELILHLLARTKHEEVRRYLSRYVTELAETRPALTGDDLREMGFTPGPIYRQILDRLLRARLDGEVDSREKEIALVMQEFGQGPKAVMRK